MSQNLLTDARLYALLVQIDLEFATAARAAGCGCGGKLHSAKYPRQPRAGLDDLGKDWSWRFSLCCAVDGCRKRCTPPSVRFLGRKVHVALVVVLMSAMTLGVTAKRASKLRELVGVSGRTLERWRIWWQKTFPASQVWKEVKARFVPAIETSQLPASLLDRFAMQGDAGGVVAVLKLLAPLTTTSYPRGSR